MTYPSEAPATLEGTEGRLWFRCRRCGDVLPERIWSEAEARRITTQADIAALSAREQTAAAYSAHPALLRLQELETLRELARTANARIYINFDKAVQPGDEKE